MAFKLTNSKRTPMRMLFLSFIVSSDVVLGIRFTSQCVWSSFIRGSGVSRPEYQGGPSTCIGVTMAHEVCCKVLNYYLFIRGVVDVATYVTYIMVHYRYYWWWVGRQLRIWHCDLRGSTDSMLSDSVNHVMGAKWYAHFCKPRCMGALIRIVI